MVEVVNYTLTYSKRKTLALYICNGGVEVRAPLKMPKSEIDKFVASKEKWIKSKLEASNDRREQRESFNLAYGDIILYRGKQYPIAAKDGTRVGFDDTCLYMPPGLSSDKIKHICVLTYRMLAKRDLTEKTIEFAKRMSVVPVAVKINGANTRWGSCSGKNSNRIGRCSSFSNNLTLHFRIGMGIYQSAFQLGMSQPFRNQH